MLRDVEPTLMFVLIVMALLAPPAFADEGSVEEADDVNEVVEEAVEKVPQRLDTAELEGEEQVEVTVDAERRGMVSDTVTSETTVIRKSDETESVETQTETETVADADGTPTADEVRRSLLEDLDGPPVTTPTRREMVRDVPSSIGVPAVDVEIDPAVLGVAPDQTPPKLRREGEFIINRRGRLIRSPRSNRPLFVFEADTSKEGQELPMVLLPCRLLQDMEQTVMQNGDQVLFIISGQVHNYRGANYLMPTTMRLAVDRGNTD